MRWRISWGIGEIDILDFQQRKIALAILGRADLALDRVAGAQAKAAHLTGRDINIVGAGKVVGLGRAQEAEAVLQNFQNAVAKYGDIVFGQLFEDREQHVLLAQAAGVLDLQILGET